MIRIQTIALLLILSGCEGARNDPATEDSESAAVGEDGAYDQAVLSKFRTFLRDNEEDLQGCFGDLPPIDDDVTRVDFREGAPPLYSVDRLVIALDASGSMAGRVGGETKMAAAKAAARDFLLSAPSDTRVGLVAFGHRGNNQESGKARSCKAVETVYPIGKASPASVVASLDSFDAVGWTPLATAITTAGSSFSASDRPGAQVVYVVSDGEETCGGDPVAAARRLHKGGTRAIINIIGFDLSATDREKLQAVARAGGGEFLEAERAEQLRSLLQDESQRFNDRMQTEMFTENEKRMTRNFTLTEQMTDALSLCVEQGTDAEYLSWQQQQNALFPGGGSMMRQFESLIEARHARYEAMRDRYIAASEQAMERANSRIDAERDGMQDEYEALEQR